MKVFTTTEIIIDEKEVLEAVWFYIHSKRDNIAALDNHRDIISKMKQSDISFSYDDAVHDVSIKINKES